MEGFIISLINFCKARYWPLPLYETKRNTETRMEPFYSTTCIILMYETIGTGLDLLNSREFAAYKMLKHLQQHPIEDVLSMIVSYMNKSTVPLDSITLLNTLCQNRSWPSPRYSTIKKETQQFTMRCELLMYVTNGQGVSMDIATQQAANMMFQCLHENPNID